MQLLLWKLSKLELLSFLLIIPLPTSGDSSAGLRQVMTLSLRVLLQGRVQASEHRSHILCCCSPAHMTSPQRLHVQPTSMLLALSTHLRLLAVCDTPTGFHSCRSFSTPHAMSVQMGQIHICVKVNPSQTLLLLTQIHFPSASTATECVWRKCHVTATQRIIDPTNVFIAISKKSSCSLKILGLPMQALVNALPELLPIIQTHLLDLLSLGLTRKPYRDNLSTAASHSLTQAIQLGLFRTFGPIPVCMLHACL